MLHFSSVMTEIMNLLTNQILKLGAWFSGLSGRSCPTFRSVRIADTAGAGKWFQLDSSLRENCNVSVHSWRSAEPVPASSDTASEAD